MFMATELIDVEVAYAKPNKQSLIRLQLPVGSTVEQAIYASNLLTQFAEIVLYETAIGIFSSVCQLDHILKPGDRVEIYRPLVLDPKAARLQRAKK
jgi:uncharacterized protein